MIIKKEIVMKKIINLKNKEEKINIKIGYKEKNGKYHIIVKSYNHKTHCKEIIDYDQISSATMNIVMKNTDNKMIFANSVICRYKNLFGCKYPENFFIKFFKKN